MAIPTAWNSLYTPGLVNFYLCFTSSSASIFLLQCKRHVLREIHPDLPKEVKFPLTRFHNTRHVFLHDTNSSRQLYVSLFE